MKTNPIPASGGKSVRALLGPEKPRSRNRRKSVTAIVLCDVPALSFRGVARLAGFAGALMALIARLLLPPLARAAGIVAVFGAVGLGVIHVGTKMTHWGLREASAVTDSAYKKAGEARAFVASLLPRFAEEDGAPRAQLVSLSAEADESPSYPRYPTDAEVAATLSESEDAPPAEEALGLIDRLADMVGLLPPLGGEKTIYPHPVGLPAIEGEVLAKAGGDRIQAVIGSVLDTVHQVEASGKLEMKGDKEEGVYKAFGPLQVRQEPCDDLEEIFKITVKPTDCNGDWALSEYVFRIYVGYWAAHVEKTQNRRITGEDLLRIWNGGPDMGPTHKTDQYVAKAVQHDPRVVKIAAVRK